MIGYRFEAGRKPLIRASPPDQPGVFELLGGRAAEKLIFGHVSTGAADDLAKATDIARSMAARYGMDDDLGYVSYDSDRSGFLGRDPQSYIERRYSEATAEKLDDAVKQVIAAVFDRALSILRDNRDILEKAAGELLTRETLDEGALKTLAQGLNRPEAAITEAAEDRKASVAHA